VIQILTPSPGFIGLTQISGEVGLGIRIGQFLNGNGFEDYEHAFIYLGGPNKLILEAEPGGALIRPLHYDDVYWCENIFHLTHYSFSMGFTFDDMYRCAQQYKGVGYSFLDYAALATHRLHIPAPGLKEFIGDTGHEICSQLCDTFYDVKLVTKIFDDDRWPGDVTPGSLYQRDLQLGGKKT
jgi:hypothetical protein